jgi:VanZ family protein
LNGFHQQRFWKLILVVMFVPLALIAFWPTPVDQPIDGQIADVLNLLHRHGVPQWFDYAFIEAFANILLFLPLGFVTRLAFPFKRWWQIGAFGLLVSGCVELGQLLFLHNRFASPSDIVTNTVGAVVGALLVSLIVKAKRSAAFRQRTSDGSRVDNLSDEAL